MGKIKEISIQRDEYLAAVAYHRTKADDYLYASRYGDNTFHISDYYFYKAFEAECNFINTFPNYYEGN